MKCCDINSRVNHVTFKTETVALSLRSGSIISAHRLAERKIWCSLMKIVERVQEIWSRHEIQG